MAAEGKYEGVQIVRREVDGSLTAITRDGEPWFLIRAQDTFAAEATRAYATLLRAAADVVRATRGSADLVEHLIDGAIEVDNIANRILIWQTNHPRAVKVPD